jgi:hypothetical protein
MMMSKRPIAQVQNSLRRLADDLMASGLRSFARRLRRFTTELRVIARKRRKKKNV